MAVGASALALAALCWWLGRLSAFIALAYAGMSLLTWLAYAIDKSAAQLGQWRTPENTLHLLALLCGWPGALIAQQQMRHKTRKPSFRLVFWVTVALNLVGLAWLLHGGNAQMLDSLPGA